MNTADQIAHLHRRVGFGITPEERANSQTLTEAIDKLLDFSSPDSFPIHPLEAFWDQQKNFQNQPQRVAAWWALRMAFGSLPARDKLLLFLHDHFAVGADKVDNGYLMLLHLQTLEQHLNQPYAKTLSAITADPAMMVFLDLTTSIRGRPNENYARELLELFTLGIDSGYTEQDIRELARVFTGWSIRVGIDGTTLESRRTQLINSVKNNLPIVAGTFAPALHDPGPYTVLNKKDEFTTESICDKLASDPRTALHVTRKLLRYYLTQNPDQKLVDKYARTFQDSRGNLAQTLRALVTGPDFFRPEFAHTIIKSPVDYLVPIIRQLVPAPQALSLRPATNTLESPIPQDLFAIGTTIITLTNRMGMLPLFPPDVAGWSWGNAWISTASMIDRVKISEVFTNQGRGRSAATKLTQLATQQQLRTNPDLITALTTIFDFNADEQSIKILVEAAEQYKLSQTIGNLDATSSALRSILRILFSVPRFHFM